MRTTSFQQSLRCLVLGEMRPGMIGKEEAMPRLKKLTGQDFGYDVQRWRQWGNVHPHVSGYCPPDASEGEEG